MSTHVRAWEVRRVFAGELDGVRQAAIRAHLQECPDCREIERTLEDERRQLEAALPFDRFVHGVDEKQRATRPSTSMRRWVQGAAALAACVTLAVIAPGLLARPDGLPLGRSANRLKGGAEVELRIAGASGGPQRVAAAGEEALGPGERVRIGCRAGTHRYVAAVSLDAHGAVSPLYPESGSSLRLDPTPQWTYLPGSLEFTGGGREKVFVVLSDVPLDMARLVGAAKAAFARAGGDLGRVASLDVPGEQFSRTLLKP